MEETQIVEELTEAEVNFSIMCSLIRLSSATARRYVVLFAKNQRDCQLLTMPSRRPFGCTFCPMNIN
jgi:hypothetical protein